MSVYIHRLETSVPETFYRQSFAADLMAKNVGTREGTKRIIRNVYRQSGIEKRHSVINDFDSENKTPLFFDSNGTHVHNPDTRIRNDLYTRAARHHFTDLASRLIRNTDGYNKEDVTHLITVSCTGFFAPGPDYFVVRDLGLRDSVERYHIGFMGCYAAFQGLKMANSFCKSHPDAVVLVLCVELCTLHLQFSDDTDSIIAASVFADGGSGALISARPPTITPESSQKLPESDRPSASFPLEMLSFHSGITPDGENDMAWTIGNEGFLMKLSTYVPDIIRKNIGPSMDNILQQAGLSTGDISRWAIHPGGRAILDKVQDALQLSDDQMAASRHVLREYGNMSSATILFVLKELARQPARGENEALFAMAFGPGLTIETGLFRCPVTTGNGQSKDAAHTGKVFSHAGQEAE